MALNSTIYKFSINLSDLNRNCFETLNLTVAQHPSENAERMMARVLAFCLHFEEGLEFTKGLSTPDSPDLWSHSLDGQTRLWIEVGEPSAEKLKKATRVAQKVCVYTFNSKSAVWWKQEEAKLSALPLIVSQFEYAEIQTLSSMLSRTMDLTVTVAENSVYIASTRGTCEIHSRILQTGE